MYCHLQVYSKTTVSPTSGSQGSTEATTMVNVNVLQWPATWDPHVQLDTAGVINTTAIPVVGKVWFNFEQSTTV